MADQIVLMDKGRIMQEASPEVIYRDPNNAFTAQFIGTPPMNILPMGEDKLGFRPERVQLGTQRLEGAPFARKGHILTREMLGSETTYKIQMGDEAIMVNSPDDSFQYDQDVVLSVLDNLPGTALEIVVFNAGVALYVANSAESIGQGVALAREALASGAARAKLDEFASFTQGCTA